MKMLISREWCLQAAEREGDCEVGACSPEIATLARELATARGHKDVEHLIVRLDGSKVPVWQFYITEAALKLPVS